MVYTSRHLELGAIVSLPAVRHYLVHVEESHRRLVWLVQLVYSHCFVVYSKQQISR
jgi:hypothetical protein